MHSFVTSKNVKWPRLIWPTLYDDDDDDDDDALVSFILA